MEILLAIQQSSNNKNSSNNDNINNGKGVDGSNNVSNADCHNYDAIAQCWSTQKQSHETFYTRMLGIYPLAAMINHSCCPNAVRVFGRIPSTTDDDTTKIVGNVHVPIIQGREVMIVHANAAIHKGTEISWSYLPPSTPFVACREMLKSEYGFTCECVRCVKEEEALSSLSSSWKRPDDWWSKCHRIHSNRLDLDEEKEGSSSHIQLIDSIHFYFIYSLTKMTTLSS